MENPAQRGKRAPAAPVLRSLLAKKEIDPPQEDWAKILFLRWLIVYKNGGIDSPRIKSSYFSRALTT
jgi:hypothetical protein